MIFADDMRTFVRDTVSFPHLINTVEQFTSYSGLKMNHEKTEVIPLGNMTLKPTEVGVNEISSIVLSKFWGYILPIIISVFVFVDWKDSSDQILCHTENPLSCCTGLV